MIVLVSTDKLGEIQNINSCFWYKFHNRATGLVEYHEVVVIIFTPTGIWTLTLI